jgi:TonB family protein
MLLIVALVALTAAGSAQDAESRAGCVDHSAEPIESKAQEPACWSGTQEIENENRTDGDPVKIPSRFDKAPLKNTAVMLKLCINEKGRVQRILLLKSSGNRELDQYLCQEYEKWRFRPPKVGERDTTSVSHVVVSLRPI